MQLTKLKLNSGSVAYVGKAAVSKTADRGFNSSPTRQDFYVGL